MKNYLAIFRNGEDHSMYDMAMNRHYIELRYSQLQETWACRGKSAAKLINTGDGLKIDLEGHVIELDYCQAQLLMLMLRMDDERDSYPTSIEVLRRKPRSK